jgi:hypothetical protein
MIEPPVQVDGAPVPQEIVTEFAYPSILESVPTKSAVSPAGTDKVEGFTAIRKSGVDETVKVREVCLDAGAPGVSASIVIRKDPVGVFAVLVIVRVTFAG